MVFKNIKVINFRNISEINISFSDRLNIIVGKNGQGKSNIAEAIYLASQGNSFRTITNDKLIQWGKASSLIQLDVEKNGLNYLSVVKIQNKQKGIEINGKKISHQKLGHLFPVVLFSPESLSAIKDGPDIRRQLIDDLLVFLYPQASALISDFKHCLKSRNKVLKDYLLNPANKNETEKILELINTQFINLSTQLTLYRLKAINSILNEYKKAAHRLLSGQEGESVDILVEYVISDTNATQYNGDQISNLLKKRVLELANAELSSGTSLVGPHKHDIRIIYNGKDSRFFCSQGQQRALILAFKIAQIVYHRSLHGSYPVLVLDDVFSELDKERRGALVSFLLEAKTQVFITSTELNVPQELLENNSKVFEIESGRL